MKIERGIVNVKALAIAEGTKAALKFHLNILLRLWKFCLIFIIA